MFDIKENLKKLPDEPGVYLHKDNLGQIIYVGKAVSLKKRVRQYFQSSKNMDSKVKAMVANIEEFEYIKCGSEVEALILENNLIKKYMPKYNILLRDDKTYPYIKITGEQWPRIVKTRKLVKDGGKYFGPYSDVGAVNQIIDFLNNTWHLKKCSVQEFPENFRPCLNYHIGQCDGICTGQCDRELYMKRIEECERFLKGRQSDILDYLKNKMIEASEKMEYEKAAVYRDCIDAAKLLAEKQRVVLRHTDDADMVLYGGHGTIAVFNVREGKLLGRETYFMEVPDGEKGNVVEAFLMQHYSSMLNGPSSIIIEMETDGMESVSGFLSELWGHKVKITVPKKGEKKSLLEMARRDTNEMIKNIHEKERNRKEREGKIRKGVSEIIGKARIHEDSCEYINQETGEIIELKEERSNYRVEAYDISNLNGVWNVGAMVVYDGLKKDRKNYRKFRINSLEGPDDYGAISEVIERRLKRAMDGDASFLPLADLILIDGGKGHVNAVYEVMKKLGIWIPVAGMAKDDSHRTETLVYHSDSNAGNGNFVEESLKDKGILFSYIGNIQEEVHRYVIEYHRNKRDKSIKGSVLDEIKGIGPKKRNSLLKHFGTIEKIKTANEQALMEAEGITRANAEEIIKFFVDKKSN